MFLHVSVFLSMGGLLWLPGACVGAGGPSGVGACIAYDDIRSMSGRYASYWNALLLKTFSDNHVKCNILLIDWILGIINSILKHPLDPPEWSVKRYPIFIPRSEVPPLDMTSSKQLTQIPCSSLNEYLDQLVWIFKVPKVSIPILVNSGFDQPLSIPILAVCESNKCVISLRERRIEQTISWRRSFVQGMANSHNIFDIYIPLIPDTELKTVSTEGIDSSTSRQSQDRDTSHLESFLAKHILDSMQGGM